MDFEGYLDLLDKLGGTIDELTGLARRKTKAVMDGDLDEVDAVMRREQALSLSLRGTEQRREKLLSALGLNNTTLSALPGRAPEGLRTRARRTAEELLRKFSLYRDASEVARTTLECNIHMIEKHMGPGENPSAPGGPVADIRA